MAEHPEVEIRIVESPAIDGWTFTFYWNGESRAILKAVEDGIRECYYEIGMRFVRKDVSNTESVLFAKGSWNKDKTVWTDKWEAGSPWPPAPPPPISARIPENKPWWSL